MTYCSASICSVFALLSASPLVASQPFCHLSHLIFHFVCSLLCVFYFCLCIILRPLALGCFSLVSPLKDNLISQPFLLIQCSRPLLHLLSPLSFDPISFHHLSICAELFFSAGSKFSDGVTESEDVKQTRKLNASFGL